MNRQILKAEQKALEINLNDKVYGTFAEIGAGQEVARNFFQVGAAAGTVAKTMSAYDKTYSDTIYGGKDAGRYVSEIRLTKMLDHEYQLLKERLQKERPSTCFFAFADTVQAINYTRTVKGNGWMGLRFQCSPGGEANELIIHVKMLDKNNRQQQQAIGILGVNLIYAAFLLRGNLEEMVVSIMDGLKSRVEIDMLKMTGPDFAHVDNRLLSLYLVKHNLTEVAIFDKDKKSIHPSGFLYKKNLMVVRGNYKPPTKVTTDAFGSSYKQFQSELTNNERGSELIAEITLANLTKDGALDEQDFLDRADMLCALGHNVIISDCTNHQALIDYLSDYKIQKLGLVVGIYELIGIFEKKFSENQGGRLLVAFGELFTQNITVYAYPALLREKNELLTIDNMPIPKGIELLFQHLLLQKQIVAVSSFDKDSLNIFPHEVLAAIQRPGDSSWEEKVPNELISIIKEKGSFGYISDHALSQSGNLSTNDATYF